MSNKAFDVATVLIDEATEISFIPNVANIDITVSNVPQNIDIEVVSEPEIIEIEVPGVQGPPGLQNVYIQETDPAVQYGWGPEQTNYIWIDAST